MNTIVSYLNVRQEFLQGFQVASCKLEHLLKFGEERLWCFLLENEKGVLEKPIQIENWRYQEYDPNSITLPFKAKERLDVVLDAGFPIRQIIYGYQVDDTIEVQPKPKPSIQIPDRAFKTVSSLATAVLTVAAGAAMVVGYAFLIALQGIDPKLIVVPDTGANEKELPWVCLMSWEGKPESL